MNTRKLPNVVYVGTTRFRISVKFAVNYVLRYSNRLAKQINELLVDNEEHVEKHAQMQLQITYQRRNVSTNWQLLVL